MDLQWLTPALEVAGPVASVHLDVSRADESGAHEVEVRWKGLRRDLEQQGTPADVLDALEGVVLAPTGRRDGDGGTGRTVVAGADGVVLDLLLPTAPAADEARWAPLAHLMPTLRAAQGSTRYLLVAADRAGADLTVATGSGITAARAEGGDRVVGQTSQTSSTQSSGADDDVLHKVPVGGIGEYTQERRVEDSWERDAAAVAKDVDDLVGRHKPEVVLLTGDTQALTRLREHLGGAAGSLAVDVPGGGRADGVRTDDFAAAVGEALAAVRARSFSELSGRFEQGRGKDADGADGFDAVVQRLQRGQVEEVLLRDDPSSTSTLWIGPGALELAGSREDLLEMGVAEPVEVRADSALLRAAVGAASGITLVPGTREDQSDELELADGIGAVLRWSDEGTPGGGMQSMSSDSTRLRDISS